jgi:hypothetical protein
MRRLEAVGELTTALEHAGVLDGRVQLSDVWPVVDTWWRRPVMDVDPAEDRRLCLLSRSPADLRAHDTVFAPSPPVALRGRELVALELARDFYERVDPISTVGLDGSGGVTLWYAATAAWDGLRQTPGWIEARVSTPNFDATGDGTFGEQLADTALIRVATAERVLALGWGSDQDDEDRVVLARC